MSEFFYMGGYALYVWSSYALAIVMLFVNVIGPLLTHKWNLQKASDLQKFNRINSDDA
jgi:heme exporter protein D